MKLIRKLMHRDAAREPDAGETVQDAAPVSAGVSSKGKESGMYSSESSFNWTPKDPLRGKSSTLFDPDDSPGDLDATQPLDVLQIEDDSSLPAEEDDGFDPYNTGRFESA